VAYAQEVGATEPLACVACGPDELAATALTVLPAMLEALAAAESAGLGPPVIEPQPSPAAAGEGPPVKATLAPSPRSRRLLIAGTLTAIAGGLLVGAGAALLAVGRVVTDDGFIVTTVDYMPLGGTLLGVGGSVLTAGVLCFGLGVGRNQVRVGVTPVLSPRVAGATFGFAF
jgi:hypothetical protein